jgi:hypothetical protein
MIGEGAVSAVRRTDRRMLFAFVAVTLIFGLLGWRVDRNQHSQAIYNWHQCQRSAKNTTKLNDTTRVFIDFLRQADKTRPNEQIKRWIKIQQGAILVVPECGPKP